MKKLRLFIMMLMAAMLPLAVQAQSTLTVHDGTVQNSNVPMYVSYFDDFTRSHVVYPASELEDMNGAQISAITFYCTSNNMPYTTVSTVELYMTEVAQEGVSEFIDKSTATMVYQGTVNFEATADGGEATIIFDTPYTYNGGNLLFGCDNTTDAGYKFVYFLGETVNGASYSGYNATSLDNVTSGTQRNFLPKTTFTYSGGAPVACARPTELEFSNLTATSVDLSWTAGGSETEWTLEVNGTEMTGITANPYTLTVNPATNYTVKVKANCSATETSNWSNTVSFTTPCATITVTETSPFMEDFNTLTAGIPNCWDNTDGTTTSSTSKWSYYATGASGACVRFNSYFNSNGNTNMLKTPVLDITQLTNPCVTFNYKNPTGGDFSVFVSTDGGATYTTALATGLTDMTDWSSLTLMLSGLDATDNVVIVFQGTSNYGNGDAYIYLDDVTVGEAPACVAPNGLAANNVTATSADIAWTANNGETEWTIEVNGTEMTGITENPYTLTTTANTEYTVRVKANCSATDESDWSGTYTFTTPCAAVATVEEDFETYTEGLPDCWAKLGAGTVTVQTSQPNSGSKSLKFSGTTGTNIVALPALESYAGLYLTFSTKPESNSYTNCGSFAVGYVTGDASTFQALATYNYNDTYFDGDVYAVMSIDVSSVPANALLAFNHMSEASYYYWFVDDVNVAAAPTCLRPTDVTVSDITTTSATIAWTDNNETAPQSWTIDLNGEETEVTTNPYTFDNLTAATIYTVKVKANCTDDDESAWSSEVAFATDCEVIVVTPANPYQEGFENEGICWTIEQVMGTYGWYTLESTSSYEGNAMAVCHYDPASESRLISPVLDITQLEEPTFTFQHHQAIYNNIVDDLHVYYRSSATEEWTLLASYTTEFADWTMETFTLPNPTATYQVAFLGHGNDGNFIWVDDINIFDNAAEPCATPTNVAVNNNVVTWTGAAANYNVQVTVAGEVVIDTTVATTTFTVEGLEEGAHASVAVQAVCAEDDLSEWSEAVEFDYTNGINNYSLKANIYPNPTTGNVTVESDAINADITVFDAFGKLMMTSKVATERTELNFSEFAPGVYMVRIANDTAISTITVVKK